MNARIIAALVIKDVVEEVVSKHGKGRYTENEHQVFVFQHTGKPFPGNPSPLIFFLFLGRGKAPGHLADNIDQQNEFL